MTSGLPRSGASTPWESYLRVAAATVLLSLGLVIAFSIVVDPFGIFHSLPDVNDETGKPEVETHIRLHKAYAVRRQRLESIVLGTSRVEFGVRPEHPGWKSAYNLALPGINIYEAYRYIEHAWVAGPIRQAVYGIDFNSLSASHPNRVDFSEDRLASIKQGRYPLAIVRDLLAATMSVDSLVSSIRTLNAKPGVSGVRADGFRVWDEARYGSEVGRLGGVVNIMRRREESDYRAYPSFSTNDPASGVDTLNTFREMVRFSHENRIDLQLFFSPSHARQWEMMDVAGVWEKFEQLKIDLVRIVEEEARRAGREPTPIWDFSGYNEVNTEPVPKEGTPDLMQWWWESVHFRPLVGFWILCRVLEVKLRECDAPRDFGRQLTTSSVEQWIRDDRKTRESYRQRNPQIMAEMRTRFALQGQAGVGALSEVRKVSR